jgi:hypothetical protein
MRLALTANEVTLLRHLLGDVATKVLQPESNIVAKRLLGRIEREQQGERRRAMADNYEAIFSDYQDGLATVSAIERLEKLGYEHRDAVSIVADWDTRYPRIAAEKQQSQ